MARVAFVIAANTMGLKFAVKDGERIHEALTLRGFEVETLPTKQYSILEKLDVGLKTLAANDTVVIYYSGHGVLKKGRLIFVLGPGEELRFAAVCARLDECRALHKLVILDCCHAGAETDWTPKPDDSVRLLLASGKLERSKELDALEGGFLSHRLHHALTQEASRLANNGKLWLNDIYTWLTREATSHNQVDGSIQVPIPSLLGNQKNDILVDGAIPTLPDSSQETEQAYPVVGNAPQFDPHDLVRTHFVGRDGLLDELDEAVDGLIMRSNGERLTSHAQSVQFCWVHGFGGMGKSWFLRRVALQSGNRYGDLRVALIDWDLAAWSEPLGGRTPYRTVELLEPIAYRCSQLYGQSALEPFWDAQAKARAAAETNSCLHAEFEEAFANLVASAVRPAGVDHIPEIAQTGRRAVADLERLLEAQGYPHGQEARVLLLERIHSDMDRRRSMFESWAKDRGPIEAVRPDYYLEQALGTALKSVCKEFPLLLLLDTCERLAPQLDRSLRNVLAPLTSPEYPILVLLGSRFRPDAHEAEGGNGWRALIPGRRFKIVPFAHDVHFTLAEVEQCLQHCQRLVEHCQAVARNLHKLTLGVPLAVRSLLDLHDAGNSILEELAAVEVNLDATRSQQIIIQDVSRRFLIHVKAPGRERDFADIVALALFDTPHYATLRVFWSERVRLRIGRLAKRYSLLADGDLHPSVRTFLRRSWRENPEPLVTKIATRLLEIIEAQAPPDGAHSVKQANWHDRWLNMASWLQEDEIVAPCLGALVMRATFDHDTTPVGSILREIEPRSPGVRRTVRSVCSWLELPAYRREGLDRPLLKLLQGELASTADPEVDAALHFWDAWLAFDEHPPSIHTLDRNGEPPGWVRACRAFEVVVATFSTIPRLHEMARRYLKMASCLGMYDDVPGVLSERALAWGRENDLFNEERGLEFAHLLHNLGRFREATHAYRRTLESLDTNVDDNAQAHAALFHTLLHHLGEPKAALAALEHARDAGVGLNYPVAFGETFRKLGQFTKAYKTYADARESHRLSPALAERFEVEMGCLNQFELKDFATAQEHFRNALRIGGDSLQLATLDVTLLGGLELEIRSRLQGTMKEAEQRFELKFAEERDAREAGKLNRLAWSLYERGAELTWALRLATLSVELESNTERLHTLAALHVRASNWLTAEPHVHRWLAKTNQKSIARYWNNYLLLFRDGLVRGFGQVLGIMLGRFEPVAVWVPMACALANREPSDPKHRNVVREFRRQLESTEHETLARGFLASLGNGVPS